MSRGWKRLWGKIEQINGFDKDFDLISKEVEGKSNKIFDENFKEVNKCFKDFQNETDKIFNKDFDINNYVNSLKTKIIPVKQRGDAYFWEDNNAAYELDCVKEINAIHFVKAESNRTCSLTIEGDGTRKIEIITKDSATQKPTEICKVNTGMDGVTEKIIQKYDSNGNILFSSSGCRQKIGVKNLEYIANIEYGENGVPSKFYLEAIDNNYSTVKRADYTKENGWKGIQIRKFSDDKFDYEEFATKTSKSNVISQLAGNLPIYAPNGYIHEIGHEYKTGEAILYGTREDNGNIKSLVLIHPKFKGSQFDGFGIPDQYKDKEIKILLILDNLQKPPICRFKDFETGKWYEIQDNKGTLKELDNYKDEFEFVDYYIQ